MGSEARREGLAERSCWLARSGLDSLTSSSPTHTPYGPQTNSDLFVSFLTSWFSWFAGLHVDLYHHLFPPSSLR